MRKFALLLTAVGAVLTAQNSQAALVEDGSSFVGTYEMREKTRECGLQNAPSGDQVAILTSPKKIEMKSLSYATNDTSGINAIVLSLVVQKRILANDAVSPFSSVDAKYVSGTEFHSLKLIRLATGLDVIETEESLILDERTNVVLTRTIKFGNNTEIVVCHYNRI